MIVRVPGSSANLGPGFDVLGLAVGRHAEVTTADTESDSRFRPADEHHPADIAYRLAGGSGRLWIWTDLPMGRGLGYSGAVRVAGAVAGLLERTGAEAIDDSIRSEAVAISARLEGHADNVAASAYGGMVVAAGDRVVPVPLGIDATLVVWIPSFTTSTDAARRALPQQVELSDAVFNLGRTALLVAAVATGRVDVLREATRDRLHQEHRLAAAEPSRRAITTALDAGAWAAWLSGSGPTVAALVDPALADRVVAAMPPDGAAQRLAIDQLGATLR